MDPIRPHATIPGYLGSTPRPRPLAAREAALEPVVHDTFDGRAQQAASLAVPSAAGRPTVPAAPAASPAVPATLALLEETEAPVHATRARPLMLGPIPPAAALPAEKGARTRALLDAMVASAPTDEARRILIDQLAVFGLDAVSLVHNHGTQITILPKGMKPEEAIAAYRLDEKTAREMKGATGGLFSSVNNMIYLREDMLSDGLSAPVSAFVSRHEFAHALDEAMGSALDVAGLYRDAKAGKGGRAVSSYALQDKAEYFADSTAAWLGPRDEFSDSLNGVQRLLAGPWRAMSGYEAPTREDLASRDPRAKAMLDKLFRHDVGAARTVPRRHKDEGYEAWLWRAHQVDPSDERLRIPLLEMRKARASGVARIEAECMIEAEYEHVEQRLQDEMKARPEDRKAVFRLVEHYMERGDRLRREASSVSGSQRAALETKAWQAAETLLLRDRAEIEAAGGRDRWQRRSDHDYLAGQLQSRGMEEAAKRVREADLQA